MFSTRIRPIMFGSNQNNKHPSIHHTIGNTHGFVLIWHMVEDFHSFWLWCPISLNMIDLTLLWDINCQTKQITFDYGMQVNLASLNSKVQKWWLPQFLNFRYVFACDFYKQHLLHVTFYRRNELLSDTKNSISIVNPEVIRSYTFKEV